MRRINTYISLLCLLALSFPGWALRSDRNQPVTIKADQVEINEKTEISHYQGNVYLKQGTLIIKADSVFVYLSKGELSKIVIDGKPATFEQKPDDNKDIVKSSANHMEYYAPKQILILKQNARVIQGANNFSGDFIEYDTLNSTVKANTDEGSDSRVHAIIHPKDDSSKNKDEAAPKQPESRSDPATNTNSTPDSQAKPSE